MNMARLVALCHVGTRSSLNTTLSFSIDALDVLVSTNYGVIMGRSVVWPLCWNISFTHGMDMWNLHWIYTLLCVTGVSYQPILATYDMV